MALLTGAGCISNDIPGAGAPSVQGEHRSASALTLGNTAVGGDCGTEPCQDGLLCVHSAAVRPNEGWRCLNRCGNDAGSCPNPIIATDPGTACQFMLPGDLTSGVCVPRTGAGVVGTGSAP